MLTKAHRQEALSRAYVQAVAACAGLGFSVPAYDYGIDMSLHEIEDRDGRFVDLGTCLEVQIKSTTRARMGLAHLKYDLEADVYAHLREPQPTCPRVLVLVVLPENESEWLNHSEDELAIRHCGYWLSLRGAAPRAAKKTVRVTIPRANVFSVAGLQHLLSRLKQGSSP